jgi:hypothetical protein
VRRFEESECCCCWCKGFYYDALFGVYYNLNGHI